MTPKLDFGICILAFKLITAHSHVMRQDLDLKCARCGQILMTQRAVHIRLDPAPVGGTQVHDYGLVHFGLDHSMQARNANCTGSLRSQVDVWQAIEVVEDEIFTRNREENSKNACKISLSLPQPFLVSWCISNVSAHKLDEAAMEDLQAVRRLKGGHWDGLETLMRRHQLKAARAAFLITHDQAAAQDVVQELFLRIYERIHQFDETYPFEPYLMRSVVNASLNAVRGTRRLTSLEHEPEDMEALLDRAASVESQVEFAQLQHEILEALSRLSPRQRAVIVQRYYLGLSEKEMALQLDVASGTVKWLLNAARDRLRGMLGQKGEPNE